jgi:hypothetical protein
MTRPRFRVSNLALRTYRKTIKEREADLQRWLSEVKTINRQLPEFTKVIPIPPPNLRFVNCREQR